MSVQDGVEPEPPKTEMTLLPTLAQEGVEPPDSNNAAVTIGTEGSGMPPEEAIRRVHPFLFEFPLWLSEEIR
jgi:hypothetical protein